MEVGRFVYGSGVLETAQGVAGQVTPVSAFVAMATVTLIGLASFRILLSLMEIDPALVTSHLRPRRRVRG